MLFNSYIFIFAFLPVCLAGFHILKSHNPTLAKCYLIGMSLWFYGYFNISYLLIMLFSIFFNYSVYRLMCRWKIEKTSIRIVCLIGVIVNLGVLFYFKYYDFFIDNCNMLFGSAIPLKGLLLPLGISFFTFQQVGFIADAYRGEIKECSLVDYALFVCFFPQLIAGPIVNHDEMLPQFAKIGQKIDGERIAKGVFVFILGMGKKVIIADTFGKSVDFAFGNLSNGINATESMLAILFYTLQLYFDFSGYCDMAIGLGQMLGIDIPLNFNSPYKATNIIDFWKRWHITLSRFFTKNIYIPLGGNRRGAIRMYVNLFIVFFLSGLWHGAGWNFILWGCMHGILYVFTRLYQKTIGKNRTATNQFTRAISVVVTFIFVNIAWVYFRAPSVSSANLLISNLWTGMWIKPSEAFVAGFNLGEFWYVMKILHLTDFVFSKYILMIVFTIVILVVTFVGKNVHELADEAKYSIGTALMLGIIAMWCIVSLSGVSTFLYFNF